MNININELGLSQIYLNQDKIHNIDKWFDPLKINDYDPLPVCDFYGNKLSSKKFVELMKIGEKRELILYGADKELTSYYYEGINGELWTYKDGHFAMEGKDVYE